MPHHRRRDGRDLPRFGVLAVLLSVLIIAGCAGPGVPQSSSGQSAQTPTSAPTTQTTTTAPDLPTTAPPTSTTPPPPPPTTKSAEAVAYVPWGPADPVVPQHYGDLARRDCDAAESSAPDGEFWDAVFAVCRSLTKGDPWPELVEAPAPPDTDNPHEQCLDAELATMVSAALAWHAANSEDKPDVVYADTGSHCYLSVYGARQLSADEDGTAPDSDQVTVAVLVDSTYSVAAVAVDGTEVSDADFLSSGNDPFIGTTTVSIHVPTPQAAGQLSIEITLAQDGTDRGTVSTTVAVAPPGGEASASSEATDGESASDGSTDSGDSADSDSGASDSGDSEGADESAQSEAP